MAAPTELKLPHYGPDPEGTHPPLGFTGYRSTALRYPRQPLVLLPQMLTEVTGPLLGPGKLGEHDNDLTHAARGGAAGPADHRHRPSCSTATAVRCGTR